MIQAIEETFPSDIAMKIFKFCRHPTAELIKKSYHEGHTRAGTYYRYFEARVPKHKTLPIEIDLSKHSEQYWNDLIERIRKDNEYYNEHRELRDMRDSDYDATTGREVEDWWPYIH